MKIETMPESVDISISAVCRTCCKVPRPRADILNMEFIGYRHTTIICFECFMNIRNFINKYLETSDIMGGVSK